MGVSHIVSELCTALSLEVYIAINVGGNGLCNVVFGSLYHIHCTCVYIGNVAVVFECCIQSCIGSTQCCRVMQSCMVNADDAVNSKWSVSDRAFLF